MKCANCGKELDNNHTKFCCAKCKSDYSLKNKSQKDNNFGKLVDGKYVAPIEHKDINSCSCYIYCKNQFGEWCVLVAKRLHRDKNFGLWNVPIGYLKPGDGTPESCISRVVREESGLIFSKESYIPISVIKIGDEYGKQFYLVLKDNTFQHQTSIGDNDNTRFIWMPISEVEDHDWAFKMKGRIMRYYHKYVVMDEDK